ETLEYLGRLFPTHGPIREATRRITERPIPADGLPILGPVPGEDALTVAVLHSGVTLAPVVGEMITKSVLRGHIPNEMAPYGLGRFGP
ncbi:MAG: FAD-binding oxidoreductase, partial [Pseudomonadota bacterium]